MRCFHRHAHSLRHVIARYAVIGCHSWVASRVVQPSPPLSGRLCCCKLAAAPMVWSRDRHLGCERLVRGRERAPSVLRILEVLSETVRATFTCIVYRACGLLGGLLPVSNFEVCIPIIDKFLLIEFVCTCKRNLSDFISDVCRTQDW